MVTGGYWCYWCPQAEERAEKEAQRQLEKDVKNREREEAKMMARYPIEDMEVGPCLPPCITALAVVPRDAMVTNCHAHVQQASCQVLSTDSEGVMSICPRQCSLVTQSTAAVCT